MSNITNRKIVAFEHNPSPEETITLDISESTAHKITMPAGNITLLISNTQPGHIISIRVTQDSIGNRLVSWFGGISWPNTTEPTLSQVGSKSDTFVFICMSTGTFDGFIAGQNI